MMKHFLYNLFYFDWKKFTLIDKVKIVFIMMQLLVFYKHSINCKYAELSNLLNERHKVWTKVKKTDTH